MPVTSFVVTGTALARRPPLAGSFGAGVRFRGRRFQRQTALLPQPRKTDARQAQGNGQRRAKAVSSESGTLMGINVNAKSRFFRVAQKAQGVKHFVFQA